MTYSLPIEIEKISCPVVLTIGELEWRFDNGVAAVNQKHDKRYLIESIYARNDEIIVCLKENEKMNDTSWCEEGQASFF